MQVEISPKLPMRDRRLTREFYSEKLGFSEFGSTDFDGYLMMERDQIQIHFFEFNELIPEENYGQLYLRTYHIDEVYQGLPNRKAPIHPNLKLELNP